ncbi:MAG: AraC family ligand binding domain-containing protein, partial [Devosiaceae bacterium]|nr:AraC family ligand binding domain-containing protein [Devosiaceae bacterium MH13]
MRRRHLSDYLAAGEAFHFSRAALAANRRDDALRGLHDHDYHELFWLTAGTVEHLVNGAQQTLGPGDLVFVRPADAHALWPQRGGAKLVNVAFHSQVCTALFERHQDALAGTTFWARGEVPDRRALGAVERRAIGLWANRLEAAGRSALALEAFLLAVLGLLGSSSNLPPGAEEGPDWLAESCRALQRADVLRAGVPGFVRVSGCAPAHVARVTRRFTGRSPSDLVAEVRMAQAAAMLEQSTVPIA